MLLKSKCVCDFSKGQWSCTCGFGKQEQLLDRLWGSTSMAEHLEICKSLGITLLERPHPSDINDVWEPNKTQPGEHHPKYLGYIWQFNGGAWRWVLDAKKGN